MMRWVKPKTVDVPEVHAVHIPFPLRAEFTAWVVVPNDMTPHEANRMRAMVRTLGYDQSRLLLTAGTPSE